MGFVHVWDSWNVVWISHSDHSGVLKIANHQPKPAIGCNSHLVYGKEYWVLTNRLLRETCCHPSKVPKQYANSEQPASGSKSIPKMSKLQSPGATWPTDLGFQVSLERSRKVGRPEASIWWPVPRAHIQQQWRFSWDLTNTNCNLYGV